MLRLSRAVDAAHKQRDAAIDAGDAAVTAIFDRALAELEDLVRATPRAERR